MAKKYIMAATLSASLAVTISWLVWQGDGNVKPTSLPREAALVAPDSFPPPSSATAPNSQRSTLKAPDPQSAPGGDVPPDGQQPDDPEPIIDGNVTVKDGRLSVHVKQSPLRWVLDEIVRQSGILILPGTEVGDPRITIDFDDLELEQGLRRLLYEWDVFVFYRNTNALRSVWFYPPGKGEHILPAPIEAWGSTQEVAGMLTDRDPAQRMNALQVLAQRNPKEAGKAVVNALADRDEEVRRTALVAALTYSIAVPTDTLVGLVYSDASATIRHDALAALSGLVANYQPDTHVDIAPIAQRAINDPDVNVQDLAEKILDGLATSAESVPVAQAGEEVASQGTEE